MFRLSTTLPDGTDGPAKDAQTRQAAIIFVAEFWGQQDHAQGSNTRDALAKGEEIVRKVDFHGIHTYQCSSGALIKGQIIEDRPLAMKPSAPVDPGRTESPKVQPARVHPVRSKADALRRLSGFGK